eukprot:8788633-Alexandrium_andersonii.AAC.1
MPRWGEPRNRSPVARAWPAQPEPSRRTPRPPSSGRTPSRQQCRPGRRPLQAARANNAERENIRNGQAEWGGASGQSTPNQNRMAE